MTTTIMEHPRMMTRSASIPHIPSPHIDSGESTSPPDKRYSTKHGRQYLRNMPYPLPVDLEELHRQNMQTMLMQQVFGKALCCPDVDKRPPQSVLEIACGTGFWSASCHDHLVQLGHPNATFTGIDIAPLAPDYRAQGIDWRFLEHDVRMVPFPFEDESYDLIVLKDVSLVVPGGQPSQLLLDEALRLLRPGGLLEIWDVDHLLRCILPHTPNLPSQPPDNKGTEDIRQALASATFELTPATPFGPVESAYLEDYNTYMQTVLDRRKLTPLPCSRMLSMLLQETDDLCEIGSRRIAIPLNAMSWERNDAYLIEARRWAVGETGGDDVDFVDSGNAAVLSAEQLAVRSAARSVFIQLIDSMESMLREASGRSSEDWQQWWNALVAELHQVGGPASGVCLEIGAFWARKT